MNLAITTTHTKKEQLEKEIAHGFATRQDEYRQINSVFADIQSRSLSR